MELPQEPATLEYSTHQAAPVVPTTIWVGCLGALIYGGLSLLFSIALGSMAYAVLVRGNPVQNFTGPGTIFVILFSFALWRAIAAFRGALRTWRKL